MKKLKLTKKRKIIILISICIIILIILLITLSIMKKQNNNKNLEQTEEKIVIAGLDNAYPVGTFNFSRRYNGNIEMNVISTKVSKFMTSSIPTLRKALENKGKDEIISYYNNKDNKIKELTGNITEDEFVLLVKEIQTLKSEDLKYVRSTYDIDSYISDSDNTFKINLQIEYENEEPLIVKIVINDKYNTIKLMAVN